MGVLTKIFFRAIKNFFKSILGRYEILILLLIITTIIIINKFDNQTIGKLTIYLLWGFGLLNGVIMFLSAYFNSLIPQIIHEMKERAVIKSVQPDNKDLLEDINRKIKSKIERIKKDIDKGEYDDLIKLESLNKFFIPFAMTFGSVIITLVSISVLVYIATYLIYKLEVVNNLLQFSVILYLFIYPLLLGNVIGIILSSFFILVSSYLKPNVIRGLFKRNLEILEKYISKN